MTELFGLNGGWMKFANSAVFGFLIGGFLGGWLWASRFGRAVLWIVGLSSLAFVVAAIVVAEMR